MWFYRTMTVDRFATADAQAFSGFRAHFSRHCFRALQAMAERFDVQVLGLERVPRGRALIVANHAIGWDVLFFMAAIAEEQGRTVWALGENLWWKVPFLRRFVSAIGVVDGTQQNADRLLGEDQLVLVLPGGMREAVKPKELRYQLLWGRRYGFVRAALRNQAPIVPLASVGTDELFDFVGDPYARGERWLGSRRIPIPLPRRVLPIPHAVKVRLLVGEPILPRGGADAADDPVVLRSMRREVEGALHELIENELARRAGMPID
jgi:1-acyl-sn-glycerol-3-phosphate acyltransferase